MHKFLLGERIAAIHDEDDTFVELFGFGEFLGNVVPDERATNAQELRELEVPNPAVMLEQGTIIYECECYMIPEAELKEYIGDRVLREIDIDDVRVLYLDDPEEDDD